MIKLIAFNFQNYPLQITHFFKLKQKYKIVKIVQIIKNLKCLSFLYDIKIYYYNIKY